MEYTKLGRIRPVHKGNWSASTAYTALEMVRSGNVSYIANKDVPAGTPLNNGEYWAVVLDVSDVITDVYEAAGSANQAAANANNVMDVKANALAATAEGNPVQIYPDEGSVIKPVLRFEPVQAGSGDPYPAGGSASLIPFDNTAKTVNGVTFTPQTNGSIHVKGTANENAVYDLFGGWQVQSGITIPAGTKYNPNTGVPGMFVVAYGYTSDGTYKGVSGVETFAENLTNAYVYLQVNSGTTADHYFVPTLTVDGWSKEYIPYSNIRPITGRTGTSLARAGKNLLPVSNKTGTTTGGIVWTNNYDGSWTANGTATANSYAGGLDMVSLGVLPAGEYTASVNPSTAATQIRMRIGNLTNGNSAEVTTSPTSGAATFTADGISEYCAAIYVPSGTAVSNVTVYLQLELGSTATAFAPYQGDTYALDFGQTVYGGVIDWNTGVLTSDRALLTLTGTEAWTMYNRPDGHRYSLNIPGIASQNEILSVSDAVTCNMFAEIAWQSLTNGTADGIAVHSSPAIGIASKIFDAMTLDEFKAYLAAQHAAGTPVQIAYKLATPITIPLTPQQITALAGLNTVYGDGDGMTVGYNKDLATAFAEVWAKLNG